MAIILVGNMESDPWIRIPACCFSLAQITLNASTINSVYVSNLEIKNRFSSHQIYEANFSEPGSIKIGTPNRKTREIIQRNILQF